MKTLTLFSPQNRQTCEVTECLASGLKELDVWAGVVNLRHIAGPDWQNYDSVMVGVSIRYDHYHAAFRELVEKYVARLNLMSSAFYFVNLVARKPEKRTLQTNSHARKSLASPP